MPSCCQGASCACKVSAGPGIAVSGTGQAQDPFVLTADLGLQVLDNATFDLSLTGSGTVGDPWKISVNFAATAKLDDLPDVNAPSPTNGQVLGWDSATSKWTNRAPTTAAAGSVLHDQSLSGDGSAGANLAVVPIAARFLATFTSGTNGVGMTDAGINQLVRGFADDVARAAASPVPDLNTLSMLDSLPGRLDYWDGTSWSPVADRFDQLVVGGQFLSLSGPYVAQRITVYVKQVSTATDSNGVFDVLDPTDLAGRAGVIQAQFQETASASGLGGWRATLFPNTDRVSATAFRLLDGAIFPGQPITGMVLAWLY